MHISDKGGPNSLEIRFFGSLTKVAEEKGWPSPGYVELDRECSAYELAEMMGVPKDQIEGVFVNGIGQPIDAGRVKPGDRVGFIPYGIPGPYRVLLGFYKKPEPK